MPADKMTVLPTQEQALPGRLYPLPTAQTHAVTGRSLRPPFPAGMREALFGMGCFWGAEKCFWEVDGVWVTAVGYAGGLTPNPTYEEVCTGRTGHAEVVRVVFDPAQVTFEALAQRFFDHHDPTQGMAQGIDIGTQYRSVLFTADPAALASAAQLRDAFQARLAAAGFGPITTEIAEAPMFFYAEEEHQQYLAKTPDGYCDLSGTGVRCPAATAG